MSAGARAKGALLALSALLVVPHAFAATVAECSDLPAAAASSALAFNRQANLAGSDRERFELEILTPLIQREIGTTADTFEPRFVAAVACWQRSRSRPGTGRLDQGTLQAMKRTWQSKRIHLGNPREASRSELAEIPTELRFRPNKADATRARREAIDALKRLRQAASEDPDLKPLLDQRHLSVVSAFRTHAQTAAIRDRLGVSGGSRVAARSVHATGAAFDLFVGGEPTSTLSKNRREQVRAHPTYRWLVDNAERFGFVNYYYEPWHWEFVGQGATGR